METTPEEYFSESDIPNWDVGEFFVPENAGYKARVELREDGTIGVRRYGRGSVYSSLPADIYQGDTLVIWLDASNVPGHVVRDLLVGFLDQINAVMAKRLHGGADVGVVTVPEGTYEEEELRQEWRRAVQDFEGSVTDCYWDHDPDYVLLDEIGAGLVQGPDDVADVLEELETMGVYVLQSPEEIWEEAQQQ